MSVHPNQKSFVPRMPSGNGHAFSRGRFLDGTDLTTFYTGQSLGVVAGDRVQGDPGYAPTDWPKANTLLRVPQCAILSSMPQWSLMWNKSAIFFPRDVIEDVNGDLQNYSYLQQWDYEGSCPDVRYFRPVCQLNGVWLQEHQRLLSVFAEVQETLASGPNPIGVIIPDWVPQTPALVRKSIAISDNVNNPARGTGFEFDAVPVWADVPEPPWTKTYPDQNSPTNFSSFTSSGIPALFSSGLGFATNVLHIHAGHFNYYPGPNRSMVNWQSWPMEPEGLWLGPTFMTTYLGAPIVFADGARYTWMWDSLDYGFTNSPGGFTADPTVGAQTLYNWYQGSIALAAADYKTAFWKHRYWATKLFHYDPNPNLVPNPSAIMADRLGATSWAVWALSPDDWSSPDGPTWADYMRVFGTPWTNEDNTYAEYDIPSHYAVTTYFPPMAQLRDAINNVFPQLWSRVTAYYNGLAPGTSKFFDLMVANLQLEGFEHPGGSSALTASSLVDTIRQHFDEHP